MCERTYLRTIRLVVALSLALGLAQAWVLYANALVEPGGSLYLMTEPPGATVWKREVSLEGYHEHLLGRTPGPLNTHRFQGILVVRLWGYAEERIPSSKIDFAIQRYPATGSIGLTPTNALAPALTLVRRWWPSVLLVALWLLGYRCHLAYRAQSLAQAGLALKFGAGMVETGTCIERYQVIGVLGAGGMARVYEARSLDWPEAPSRALKLLQSGQSDEIQRARFLREAALMRECQHPNLISLLDYGEFEGRFFLVMEKVTGETLDATTRRARPAPALLLAWARQIASALRYLHLKGLVHRDVKPSNVMIREDGKAILMDLGITRRAGPTDLTQEGQAVGTPGYMAPEQIRGEEVDYRADLYSLGVLLFQSLSSRLPFEGETALELISAQLRQTPVSLESVRPDLDPRLLVLVDRLLSPDPALRSNRPDQLEHELAELADLQLP